MNKDNSQKSKSTKPHANKKVFDVMRPGKAPASPTSRPVITGHTSKVKEDMFVASGAPKLAAEDTFGREDAVIATGSRTAERALVDQDKLAEDTAKIQEATSDEYKPTAPSVPEGIVEKVSAVDTPEEDSSASRPSNKHVAESADEQDDASLESILNQFREQGIPAEPAEDAEAQYSEPEPQLAKENSQQGPAVEGNKPEQHQHNDNSGLPEKTPPKPFTPDEVVAATGAPVLDHAFVSHHKSHTKWWEWVLIFLLIILLGLVALNFLLDAEVISLNRDVPHTNLIK
jgi:hypothetical protein